MVRLTIVLVLGILSMETLAVPLNLEVSIKGSHNGNTTDQDWTSSISAEQNGCAKINDVCAMKDCNHSGCILCCEKGLKCVKSYCRPGNSKNIHHITSHYIPKNRHAAFFGHFDDQLTWK